MKTSLYLTQQKNQMKLIKKI